MIASGFQLEELVREYIASMFGGGRGDDILNGDSGPRCIRILFGAQMVILHKGFAFIITTINGGKLSFLLNRPNKMSGKYHLFCLKFYL